jgi:uncharacterized protein YndB with AHSA1/START domain
MRWVLIVGGVLVLLVGLLFLVGAFIPRQHRATCRAVLRAAPETIFAVLTDVDGYPTWRPEVRSVRRIEPLDGRPAYVEESKHGPVRYAVESSEPPRRLVLRIADDSLPYGGTWTFALAPSAEGTALSITEDGFIGPPPFRVMARFLFGVHATLEQYLSSLARKLGETAVIERVE